MSNSRMNNNNTHNTGTRSTTALMADQILQDFFNDDSLKIAHSRKKGQSRPPVLKAINNSSSILKSSQSTDNIEHQQIPKHKRFANSSLVSQEESSSYHSPAKPLKIDDFHRISDLMHRVSAVSGFSPDKPHISIKPMPSNVDIANNMNEVQLEVMRDSASLKDIMNNVACCYDELQAVITDHLHFRMEVGQQVHDINKNYIELFECMLSQVLKTQRTKFKTQTAEIERLKLEILELQRQLVVETEYSARMAAENKLLIAQVKDLEDQRSHFLTQIAQLKVQVSAYQQNEEMLAANQENSQKSLKQQLKELKITHKAETENNRMKYAKELKALQKKLAATLEECNRMKETLKEYEASRLASKNLELIQFKRPSADNCTQTEVTDSGLWDKQDGWVLPLSKTAVARIQWRRGINFAHCKSCKGIGKYTSKVVALYKALRRGADPVPSAHTMTDIDMKWTLPDEYVQFLSNLPKTVQATNPKSLQWIVRIVTYLFNGKHCTDREDALLGYNLQGMNEYVVEMFLLRLETRSDAELGLYKLLTTLREHYRKHPMLMAFARFLSIVDTPSAAEIDAYKHELLLNEQALKRKRESEITELKPRLRAKILQHIKVEKLLIKEQNQHSNSQFEAFLDNNYKSLDLSILSIYLYARRCCMFNNYSGVYSRQIREAKQKSLLLAMSQNALMGGISNNPLTILDHIYSVPAQDIPDHLCIGEHCVNWIPLDRAVRVLRVFVSFLSPQDTMAVYHSFENHAVFLFPDGRLDLPEGMHTLIRKATRLFANSKSDDAADLSWFDVHQTYQHVGTLPDSPTHLQQSEAAESVTTAAVKTNAGAVSAKEGFAVAEDSVVLGCEVSAHQPRNKNTSKNSKHHKEHKDFKVSSVTNGNNSSSISVGHPHKAPTSLDLTHSNSAHHAPQSKSHASHSSHTSHSTTHHNTKHKHGLHPIDTTASTDKPHHVIEVRGGLLDLDVHTRAVDRHYEELYPDVIMVDMDHLLQLIVDSMLIKVKEVETRLKSIFVEGDLNGDGVLSFQEFTAIAARVAPQFPQRKILKMFREALTQGDDNDFIGPEAFLSVCKAYGLVQLLDLDELRRTKLKALSDPPIVSASRVGAVEQLNVTAAHTGNATAMGTALGTRTHTADNHTHNGHNSHNGQLHNDQHGASVNKVISPIKTHSTHHSVHATPVAHQATHTSSHSSHSSLAVPLATQQTHNRKEAGTTVLSLSAIPIVSSKDFEGSEETANIEQHRNTGGLGNSNDCCDGDHEYGTSLSNSEHYKSELQQQQSSFVFDDEMLGDESLHQTEEEDITWGQPVVVQDDRQEAAVISREESSAGKKAEEVAAVFSSVIADISSLDDILKEHNGDTSETDKNNANSENNEHNEHSEPLEKVHFSVTISPLKPPQPSLMPQQTQQTAPSSLQTHDFVPHYHGSSSIKLQNKNKGLASKAPVFDDSILATIANSFSDPPVNPPQTVKTAVSVKPSPEVIAQQLQAQHSNMLRNVDVKSLRVNETASKTSGQSILEQLKLRRENRGAR